ncbi:MAG: tRNA pseudouridine(55) synthase TruB [Acidimicrobiales bacterium]
MTPTSPGSPVDGLVVVDKPAGWTSHDVVARCRGVFSQRRVGHAGTLDPSATGVLLVGLGRATRLLRFVGGLPKTYVGEVVLGIETSTLDSDGEVVARHDMTGVGLAEVQRVAGAFVGRIEQVPPMVSALKVGGRRLHELARAGIEVERRPREVTVHELAIRPCSAEPGAGGTVFEIKVRCSAGTYVRSLAADLGRALGGGAHLRSLRRIAIGSFTLDAAYGLDELTASVGVPPARPGSLVLTPAQAVRDLPSVQVGPDVAAAVSHGAVLSPRTLTPPTGEGPWAVLDSAGELVAVYEQREGDRIKPAVVLAP